MNDKITDLLAEIFYWETATTEQKEDIIEILISIKGSEWVKNVFFDDDLIK